MGWAGGLALIISVGLLVSAAAGALARQDPGAVAGPAASLSFWLGIILIMFPAGLRLLSRRPSSTERVVILVMVGLALYLVKMLDYPTMFTYFDEFLHLRSVEDILQTGHLFVGSPLLPVSPSFPGLENLTAALAFLSGSSGFVAGSVVLGVGRVLLMLSLYLFYVRMGGSERVAGVAAFIYMANPNFLFFTSQFAYESLALPIAVFALYVVARREFHNDSRTASWVIVGTAISATVVTHHVTSIALFAFLVLWTVVAFVMGRGRRAKNAPLMPAIITGAATYVWLIAVAGIVVGYLAPAADAAARQVVQLFQGGATRSLFIASGAPRLPIAEQVLAWAAIGLLLLGIAWGSWRVWRHGLTPPLVALGLGALAYPLSLVARLTEQGASLSDRASAFVFLAVGFMVASFVASGEFRE
ncbi:MAG: hypothetical protein ACXWD8_18370, partial [Mycobacterium sp.]